METKSHFILFKNDRISEFNLSKEFILDLNCHC